jgi:hypothetical protein
MASDQFLAGRACFVITTVAMTAASSSNQKSLAETLSIREPSTLNFR